MTAVRPEHLCERHAGTDDLPADGITGASGMAPRPPGKFQPRKRTMEVR